MNTPNPDAVEALAKARWERETSVPWENSSNKPLAVSNYRAYRAEAREDVRAAEPHIRKAVLAEVREKLLSDEAAHAAVHAPVSGNYEEQWKRRVNVVFDAAFPEEATDVD